MTKQMETVLSDEIVTKLRQFIEDKTNHPYGIWKGRLTKQQQFHLFGCAIGSGMTLIDGEKQVISHQRTGNKHKSFLIRAVRLNKTNWASIHSEIYSTKSATDYIDRYDIQS